MSGAGFIVAINIFVAALFALAFFLVAATNRSDKVARWFGLAYVCGLVYLGCEFIQTTQENPSPSTPWASPRSFAPWQRSPSASPGAFAWVFRGC